MRRRACWWRGVGGRRGGGRSRGVGGWVGIGGGGRMGICYRCLERVFVDCSVYLMVAWMDPRRDKGYHLQCFGVI